MRQRFFRLWSALLIFMGACSVTHAEWYWGDASIMGTNIEVQVWADSQAEGDQAIQGVFDEMEQVNQRMSPYIESSAVAQVNRHASTRPVTVDPATYSVIKQALAVSELTDGAFDITFASVGFMYDYRHKTRPDDSAISQNLGAINYRFIQLDDAEQTVFFTHPDVKIDLGGIAKGYAVDCAIVALQQIGIEHALVTAGGDTRLLGDRRGRPWIVGIRDPRNDERQAVKLPLESTAISTSGDYERFFEEDGVRYHHILSPKTGKSAQEVQSVSVIGPSSTMNDALSTSVFVLGVVDGMDLINRLPDVEAIILDNQRKLHYSSGLTR
ncbi:FAD:protein FMN transferase [Alteromonas sp. CYL-A6]|uniref:FAD:protein FMN transferase n=1 Tax=Alteromonas nitratireducens TaxID=3390813 RepID=UPI0034B77192